MNVTQCYIKEDLPEGFTIKKTTDSFEYIINGTIQTFIDMKNIKHALQSALLSE